MTRRGRFRQLAAAGGALLVILAAEVGIPMALIRWVGWPLLHAWPGWQKAWEQLQTNGIPNDVLFDTLAVLVWIGWAYLSTVAGAELLAELRGLPVAARRSLGPLQPIVGALMATIVIALTAGWTRCGAGNARPLASLAASLTAARPVATPAVARVAPLASGALVHSQSPAPNTSYVVRRGDSLWRIAGERLHNALRWPRIWERNRERQEPGGRVFTDPSLILPGWQLELPAADAPDVPQPPDTNTPRGGASGGDARPSASPSTSPVPGSSPKAATATPTPADPIGVAGSGCTPAAGNAQATPTRPPAPSPSAPHEGPHSQGSGLAPLPMGGAVTLTVAGAVLAALAAARLHQRRRRALESAPDGVADRVAALPAITSLGRQVRTPPPDDGDPPPVTGVGYSGQALSARHAQSPDAITIPVTVDARGNEVAIDLLDIAGVALDGPGSEAALRAVIVGLLAQHDPAHAEVVAVGSMAALIAGLADAPGVTAAPLDRALTFLEEQVMRRSRILAQRQASNYRDLRGSDDPPQGLLVVARADELGAHLAALATIGGRLGISVVAVGRIDGLRSVHVGADGTLDPGLGDATRLSFLPPEPAAQLLAAVVAGRGVVPAVATAPSASPPTQLAILDGPLRDGSAPSGARRVEVRVFGGLRVLVDGREVSTGLRRTSRALLALLAARPGGVTMEEGLDLLWHEEGRPDAGRTEFHAAINSARGRIRDLLGTQEPMVISYVADRYRIDDDLVDVDVWQFGRDLQRAALAADDATRRDALERACARVAGEPLAGVRGDWTETVREELRRRAVDALVQLSDLREAAGQSDAAIEALQSACAADPYEEALARQLMRTQIRHGRRDAAERTFRVLAARLAELDTEPDDETEDLLAPDEGVGLAARTVRLRSGSRAHVAIFDEER